MNPMVVAIAFIMKEDSVLVIRRRNQGTFPNVIALPGGKVEFGEHVSDAIVREIKEETGVETRFVSELGLISELVNDGKLKHFVIHLCELEIVSGEISDQGEGVPEWVDVNSIEARKDEFIPSDYAMIHQVLKSKNHFYWDSEITIKDGNMTFTVR